MIKTAMSRRKHCYDYPRPAVTVDIVLFHRAKRGARVLLIQRKNEPFKGHWAFPGGFVDENESLEAAAARELREETGLEGIKLEQIGAFGDPGRDPRGHTVSVVFGAVLDEQAQPGPADDAEAAEWHSAFKPPDLAFDHRAILRAASERLLRYRRGRKRK
ncbi:MAG: NUDIX hydrolase [Blastocatellia bacterium]